MSLFKNMSLKLKGFIGFTIFAILGFGIYWAINIAVVRQTLKKQMETQLVQSVSLVKIAVETYINQEDTYIDSVKQTLINVFGNEITVNNRKWRKYLIRGNRYYLPTLRVKQKSITQIASLSAIKQNLQCESFLIYQKSSKGFIPINDSTQKVYNLDEPFYQDLMKTGFYQNRFFNNGVWYLNLYFSFKDNNGHVLGFYLIQKKLTEFAILEKKLLSFKIGQSGYPFIINTDGLTILHPAKEGVNALQFKDIHDFYFIKEMVKKKTGSLTYFWPNKELGDTTPRAKHTVYLFIPQRNWIVAVSAYVDDFFAPIKRIKKLGTIIGLILLAIAMIFILGLVSLLTKPFGAMFKTFKVIEEGDLSQSLVVKNNDEIGVMAKGFNKMLLTFRNIITNLSKGLIILFDKKNNLNEISQRVLKSSELQGQALENVANAVSEVKDSVTQVSDKIQGLAANTEEITATVEELSASTISVADKAHDIKEKAESATEAMLLATEVSHNTTTSIKNIEESSNSIRAIVTLINDISDQTNLLALNASIEAARAGDAGRGFAVVAKEISNLADKSANATKEIESLIGETGRNVQAGVALASQLDEAMSKIRNALNLFTGHASDMTISIEEEKQGFEQISTTMQTLSMDSQNVASASEEISSAIEEINNNLHKSKPLIENNFTDAKTLNNITTELSEIAENLNEMIRYFKGID